MSRSGLGREFSVLQSATKQPVPARHCGPLLSTSLSITSATSFSGPSIRRKPRRLAARNQLQIVDKLFCCAEATVLRSQEFQSEFHSSTAACKSGKDPLSAQKTRAAHLVPPSTKYGHHTDTALLDEVQLPAHGLQRKLLSG